MQAHRSSGHPARRLALVHGLYYLTTGIWPILHIRSFERVSGPKTDHWLVKTVGALVGVTGGILLRAGLRRRKGSGGGPSRDLAAAAAGQAAALAAVDVIYVCKGRISPVYLLDAVAEAGLLAAWAAFLRKSEQ